MKKYNPVVENETKIMNLITQFEQAEAVINQRIYNSQTDEKNRIIRLKETKILKGNLGQIAPLIQQQALHDMHPDLNLEDVKPGTFFLSSKQTDRLPVRILELSQEKIAIEWFGPEGTKFNKTLTMKQINKTHVKVNYFDYVKGFKTIYGLKDTHFKHLYVVKQSLIFQIQMNKVLIDLSDDEKEKVKLLAKNDRLQEKMLNKY